MKWVMDLPIEVQNEIVRDAVNILSDYYGDEINLYNEIDCLMREKLVNIIGDEGVMLSPDKYAKYIFM